MAFVPSPYNIAIVLRSGGAPLELEEIAWLLRDPALREKLVRTMIELKLAIGSAINDRERGLINGFLLELELSPRAVAELAAESTHTIGARRSTASTRATGQRFQESQRFRSDCAHIRVRIFFMFRSDIGCPGGFTGL